MGLNRRGIKGALAAGVLAIVLAGPTTAHAQSVLRLVPQADLKILDTVQTTNNITSNHGYMIYDTLFSLDSKLMPKPQMVESYTKSADGLNWKFKLRPGLKFHDGQPVTSKDVVASILRFSKRIPAGVTMMQFTKEIVATGPDTFEIRLNKPFGLVLETLAGPENPLFITREADALGDPNTAITTAIGSGPFIFVTRGVGPRQQGRLQEESRLQAAGPMPPDGFAGAKLAKVDRVEWLVIPDSNTAVQALIKGEVDIIEIPQTDLLPLIRKDPNITVKVIDRVGTQAIYRMNHLIPPFNNAKARQALLYATGDQKDYLASMIGFADYERPCWAVFVCGTPLETQAGVGSLGEGRQEGQYREGQGAAQGSGLQGREGRDPRSGRGASRAFAGGGHRAEAARDRHERRPAGDRLGHAERAPPDQGSAGQEPRRMEHLPHVGRRPGDEQPAVQHADAERRATARTGSAGRATRSSRRSAWSSRSHRRRSRRRSSSACRSASTKSFRTFRPVNSSRRSPIARISPASRTRRGSCSGTSRRSRRRAILGSVSLGAES